MRFRLRQTAALVAATSVPLTAGFVAVGMPVAADVDPTAPVFVNEIHYDNDGGDTGEFVEVAGPAGTDLTGWSIVLYNGNGGASYSTTSLAGIIPDQAGGFGTLSFAIAGIQNGSPDGVALVDTSGAVVEFWSYEGTFLAVGGPADGILSTDLGVSEPGDTPIGFSLALTGSGTLAGDFAWQAPGAESPGGVNAGQDFNGGPAGPSTPVINEVGVNDIGPDDEFVEILGDADTDYSAYALLSIEGDDTSPTGTIDAVVPIGTTGSDGLFTVDPAPSFENGSNSFLLVEGFTGALGDDLDIDDDGTLDSTPWTSVADGVAIDDGDDGDLHYATPVLDESFDDARIDNGFAPGGLSRIPDGVDTDTAADWYRNDFSWDGVTNGSPEPGEALNTPGAPNEIVPVPAPAILINEIDSDQDGTDAAEFVELTDGGVGNTPLDGLVLVLYNGNDDASYEAYDLDGQSTGGDGYFVACANPATTANCDLDIDGFFSASTNVIQNGADAVALYEGDAADFPNDTPVTADGLIDAVVYDTNDADDTGLLALLNATGGQLNEGANGNATGESNSRCPDSSGEALDTSTFVAATPTPGATNSCDGAPEPELTLISTIQGSGAASPLDGTPVLISGIVVGDFQAIATDDPVNDEPLDGFFVQEEDADADGDASTSEGIFVFAPGAPDVAVGDLVEVTGTVDEFFGLTEITNVSDVTIVSSGNPLPTAAMPTVPTEVGDEPVDYEAIEGMLVTYTQPLYVTDTFPLGSFGEVQLSAIGAQDHPNQVFEVGSVEAEALRQLNLDSRVILEDGEDENESFPSGIPTWNPEPTPFLGGPDDTLRSGDVVNGLTGVVNFAFGEYEVVPVNVDDPLDPDGAVDITYFPRPESVPDVGGDITVASFNVLNYFVTIDQGGATCGPLDAGCRGADTQAEFDLQSAKIADAIADLDADVVGLIEIENSANDEAVADLVAKINAQSDRTYDYVPTGFVGTDVIVVGFIYDPATVDPVGDFAVLDSSVSPAFLDDLNRPAIAQTFREEESGQIFTVAVNHLKSKGSPCTDVSNPGDPAFGVDPYGSGDDVDVDFLGNCNLTREAAATVLGQWVESDPTGTGATRTMIIGDLNSYANESPITTLEAQGYTDLVELFAGGNSWDLGAHTYVFDGEHGSLDYALADPDILSAVTGAAAWHINADEPGALDYQNFNPDGQASLDEFRSSDHDPVVVGLAFEPVLVCGTVSGTEAELTAAGFNVIIGTDGGDKILGTGGADFVLAGAGDDHVLGLQGDDVLCGGEGSDRIIGNGGDDLCDPGPGDDPAARSCETVVPEP